MALPHCGFVLSPSLTLSSSPSTSSSSSSSSSSSYFPPSLIPSLFPFIPTRRKLHISIDVAPVSKLRDSRRFGRAHSAISSSLVSLPTADTDEKVELEDGKNPAPMLSSAEAIAITVADGGCPKSERFGVIRFHHVEFWCGDASNMCQRFCWGLGMHLVAKSDQTTGNQTYCSYVTQSNEIVFVFTAPLSSKVDQTGTFMPHPGFDSEEARNFFATHGVGVKAVGLLVEDAEAAFNISVANGAFPVLKPQILKDASGAGEVTLSEVRLYGDVVLRFISKTSSEASFEGVFLPNYEAVVTPPVTYGLARVDHVAGNVEELLSAVNLVAGFTGFHEMAEFKANDVGTGESGLNSMVLANDTKMVLLPINEPVYGTKRKSQVQTFLEHNEGPGVQHLALLSHDICATVKELRSRTELGGFDFMPKPPPTYYANLRNRVADMLTEKQMEDCAELGILVDRDHQGVIMQIFTKPTGDRPTMFIEVIQRIGCMEVDKNGKQYQRGGCGGFGRGNAAELFKSVEEYEKTLDGSSR